MFEDELLKVSMSESIRAKKERLLKETGMMRPFTPDEENIMRKGFVDAEDE